MAFSLKMKLLTIYAFRHFSHDLISIIIPFISH